MKVSELIEKLQKTDPDYEVILDLDNGTTTSFEEVEELMMDDQSALGRKEYLGIKIGERYILLNA